MSHYLLVQMAFLLIETLSTFDDVLLKRPSWPSKTLYFLLRNLRVRIQNEKPRGIYWPRTHTGGAGVGEEKIVLSFSFSCSALASYRKGKKKLLCTDHLTWCIIHTTIIVSDPGLHKCPIKLLPKICDNSFLLFIWRPSKNGKTFKEFPEVLQKLHSFFQFEWEKKERSLIAGYFQMFLLVSKFWEAWFVLYVVVPTRHFALWINIT